MDDTDIEDDFAVSDQYSAAEQVIGYMFEPEFAPDEVRQRREERDAAASVCNDDISREV